MKKINKYLLAVILVIGLGFFFASCGSGRSQYGCPERIAMPH